MHKNASSWEIIVILENPISLFYPYGCPFWSPLEVNPDTWGGTLFPFSLLEGREIELNVKIDFIQL